MRFKWWVFAGAVLTVLALTLAACGGGDDDDNNGPAATEDAGGNGDEGDGGDDDSGADDDGGGDGGDNFSGQIDPCEIFTAEDAEEFLDEPVAEPEKSGSGPYNVCTYNAADELAFKFIIVQVRENISKDEFEAERDASEQVLGTEVVEVDDIGDSAYDVGGLLFVHEGSTELVISAITGFGGDEDQEKATLELNKSIAARALDRLD